jgi:hypothetical protein
VPVAAVTTYPEQSRPLAVAILTAWGIFVPGWPGGT